MEVVHPYEKLASESGVVLSYLETPALSDPLQHNPLSASLAFPYDP